MRGQNAEDAEITQRAQKNTRNGFGLVLVLVLVLVGLVWFGFVLGASTLHSLTSVIPAQAGIYVLF